MSAAATHPARGFTIRGSFAFASGAISALILSLSKDGGGHLPLAILRQAQDEG
jgi:hypothetical protein